MRNSVIGVGSEDELVIFGGGGVILQGVRSHCRDRIEHCREALLLLLILVRGHRVGLFPIVEGFQPLERRLPRLGLCVRCLQRLVSAGAYIECLRPRHRSLEPPLCVDLFAEGDHAIGVLDRPREILQRIVGQVVVAVDKRKQGRVGVLLHKVIEHLDLLLRILLAVRRLVGVVFRQRVLRLLRLLVLLLSRPRSSRAHHRAQRDPQQSGARHSPSSHRLPASSPNFQRPIF